MRPDCTPKLGQSDLLYGSKSPAEEVGVNGHFQASWAIQPIGCLIACLCLWLMMASIIMLSSLSLNYDRTSKTATNKSGHYDDGYMLWLSEQRTCKQLTAPGQSQNYQVSHWDHTRSRFQTKCHTPNDLWSHWSACRLQVQVTFTQWSWMMKLCACREQTNSTKQHRYY